MNSPQSVNGVLYNQDGTSLLAYPLNKASLIYEVNSAVQELADFAFYGTKNLNSLIVKNQTHLAYTKTHLLMSTVNSKSMFPQTLWAHIRTPDIWKDHADIIFPKK